MFFIPAARSNGSPLLSFIDFFQSAELLPHVIRGPPMAPPVWGDIALGDVKTLSGLAEDFFNVPETEGNSFSPWGVMRRSSATM